MTRIPPLIAPRAGQITTIDRHPGSWQIVAQSPTLRFWWAMPWSNDARADEDLKYGHIKAHVIDIKAPIFNPGPSLAALRITYRGIVRDRLFMDIDEALKIGVRAFLTDHDLAKLTAANGAVRKVRKDGFAEVNGVGFEVSDGAA